jgi:hypothetical protein
MFFLVIIVYITLAYIMFLLFGLLAWSFSDFKFNIVESSSLWLSWSVHEVLTKYCVLGGLEITEIYFLQFWRLTNPWSSSSRFSDRESVPSWSQMVSSYFLYILTRWESQDKCGASFIKVQIPSHGLHPCNLFIPKDFTSYYHHHVD